MSKQNPGDFQGGVRGKWYIGRLPGGDRQLWCRLSMGYPYQGNQSMSLDKSTMRYHHLTGLIFVMLLAFPGTASAGAIILGLNLEFIEARFNDEGFDGGLGIHVGYEFKEWKSWHFGGLLEYMNGWYDQEDLEVAGEMMYDSISLYATARPRNWPLVFKAGFVDADYMVLQETLTQNFRDVSDTGYAYGVALAFGSESFRLDLIDIKRVKIGSDTFNSYGISLAILFGGAGSIK